MENIFTSLTTMLYEMAPYILLGLLVAGLLHAFVPATTMSHHLARPGIKGVVKATLIGVPLPLCSCGVLPTAVALRRSGASKSATTSFLISTPQTGVDSIAATYSLLGPAFAIIRPLAAIFTAVFGGMVASRDECDSAVGHDETEHHHESEHVSDEPRQSLIIKMGHALRYGFYDMVQSIGSWLVVGLVVAALITVLVPADFFAIFAQWPLLSMLAVVAVAVPMYVCATGSIPIALSLMLKGLSPGTAFVLLMAGPAANLASVTILTRAMGRRSALIYVATIVVGALAFGLCIDYLMPRSWFPMPAVDHMAGCHGHSTSMLQYICGAVFVLLLVAAAVGRLYDKYRNHNFNNLNMTKKYQIKGMNCPHCQKSVQQAISTVNGVETVVVDLASGVATVEGNPDDEALKAAVEAAGFDIG